jgi:hypothetical protein
MTFLDQDNNGMDVYRVDFAHGFAQWRIARPNREGKIWYRNFWGMPTASRSRENPK